jgi:hypothetical protein
MIDNIEEILPTFTSLINVISNRFISNTSNNNGKLKNTITKNIVAVELINISTYHIYAKGRYIINFLNSAKVSETTGSLIIINDDIDTEINVAGFSLFPKLQKFKIDNYKVINFNKIFKQFNIQPCLTINNKTLYLTINNKDLLLTCSINLVNFPTLEEFLVKITECCNQILLFKNNTFKNYKKFINNQHLKPLNVDVNINNNNLQKILSLDDKLEFLVDDPVFNFKEYEASLTLIKAKQLNKKFNFTINHIKFTFLKGSLFINIAGISQFIKINADCYSDICLLAYVLQNLNIYEKFKSNLAYFTITTL